MKKRIFRGITALLLVAVVTLCGAGCEKAVTASYIYEKQCETGLYFYSSSPELDRFLNDYFDRHSRRNEKTAINGMQLGTEGSSWKAWDAMSLMWFDSTASNFRQDSYMLMKNWLLSETVDDYGYAWTEAESLEVANEGPGNNTFGMGWPFPNYGGSGDYDWDFNSYADPEGWSVGSDGTLKSVVADGLYQTELSGATYVTFTKNNRKGKIYTEESPFLEFDIRWALDTVSADDIYVSWKTRNSDQTYTVKASDYSVLSADDRAVLNKHFYLAMYLNEHWGTDQVVTDLSLTVKAKTGKTLDGSVNLNFVRGNYDSRQLDNGYAYLEAAKMYYEFTGDTQVLQKVLGNCLKITAFMVYNLDGQSGLCDLSKFVGHDGGIIDDGVAHTIASSYWDVLSLSPKSLYAQTLYYRTLQDMIYLLGAAETEGISVPEQTVQLFDGGNHSCTLSVDELNRYCKMTKAEVTKEVDKTTRTGFFDPEKGRFIEGFNGRGEVVDYGSTVFNTMALWAGLATEKQAKSVTEWIAGKRTVKGDDSTGKDIYAFHFAPRVTTVKNAVQYTAGHAPEAGYPFGTSVQDGGAIAFTSFYDLMTRLETDGVDNAFGRLSEIRDWYLDVYDYSAKSFGSNQFYRAYYQQKGINLQGGGTAGALGLDTEFLENAILYAAVPFGFFGLESTEKNILTVHPSLPSELDFWRMENLMYHDVKYDLEIGGDYVVLESVRGNTNGLQMKVCLKTKNKTPKVYIDGEKMEKSEYTVSDGTICVKVPFCAQKITVR